MHIGEWHIFKFERLENLNKEQIKLQFGLKPQMPDPVPEFALEPSVHHIRICSGNSGSSILQ
jgi:hypothetical protein